MTASGLEEFTHNCACCRAVLLTPGPGVTPVLHILALFLALIYAISLLATLKSLKCAPQGYSRATIKKYCCRQCLYKGESLECFSVFI